MDISNRLGHVNGLRGLAILAVIFHHSWAPMFTPTGRWHSVLNTTAIPICGFLGVDLFFVLSGFVLFLPYAAGKRKMDRAGTVEYFKRRAARILPLYFIVILLCTIFGPGKPTSPGYYQALFANLTMTFPAFKSTWNVPVNFALWSLGTEIWFSIIFPICCINFQRFGWRSQMVVCLAISMFSQSVLKQHVQWQEGLFPRLQEFGWGMAAAAIYTQERAKIRPIYALFGALTLLAACQWSGTLGGTHGTYFRPVVGFSMFLILLGGLAERPYLLTRQISRPTLQLIGMMCYSIYVWHVPVQNHVLSDLGLNFALVLKTRYLLYLASVFVVAAVSYRYIEFPHVTDIATLLPEPWRSKLQRRWSTAIPPATSERPAGVVAPFTLVAADHDAARKRAA